MPIIDERMQELRQALVGASSVRQAEKLREDLSDCVGAYLNFPEWMDSEVFFALCNGRQGLLRQRIADAGPTVVKTALEDELERVKIEEMDVFFVLSRVMRTSARYWNADGFFLTYFMNVTRKLVTLVFLI